MSVHGRGVCASSGVCQRRIIPRRITLLRHLLPRRRVFHPDPTKGGGHSRHPFGIPIRGGVWWGTHVPRRAGDDECGRELCALARRENGCGVGLGLGKFAVTLLPLRASRAQGSKGSTSGGSNSEAIRVRAKSPWWVFRVKP